ncbi:alanine--tRNA ligase [Blattabacterium sp. (Blaberus giganteus)]|uniref:alanine--tRNA ligase n=1 Tax=Blattabacterium sp. (Blaberus giganteus) TaxID=1186051 RepID=UPI00025F6E21|nr:alanine--tRNA ligase [Blattabacterium sp. (Blaberus giganteus)]AFJ90499.1 alanine-tRNA ligase [Blattabacterium sp. (Blaberus giganteus)]
MKYKLIKNTFLSFFQKKKHKIIPSFPIYLKNDPSLLFINAGMNPFKDYFLGHIKPEYTRIANIQKCLRITGKHNDLKNVGYDNYHHTMFEMLGNWSFGDYSRKETIEWAWELLIEVYNIPNKNIYVSVFIGDKKDELSMDKETLKYWKTLINKNNILFFGKKENFWEMGLTGPCGPCSEIHIDLRNDKEKKVLPGRYLINRNHPEVIEIWNLVFIEFIRKTDGTLKKLSTKHIDTGMGLERLCMILQGKISSYETDIFYPIIQDLEDDLGNIYNREDFHQKVSIQIIADHLRAIVFSISDGKLPSNNGAGYVIRKILRRAIIFANRFLYKKEPFIHKFVDSLVREMKNSFPELLKKKTYIQDIIKEEELSFFNVIEKGNKKIQHIITKHKEKNEKIVGGETIFQLYDTYGFPIQLSKILVEKNNLFIDEKSFQKKLLEQQDRSKKEKNSILKKDWINVHNNNNFDNNQNFIGYDFTECDIFILKYREIENKFNKIHYYELVFSKTPFYPEGGGQLGDTGIIENEIDKIDVFNTKRENYIIIHCVRKLPLNIFSSFKAIVNKDRRSKIEKNHTSTHLLHFVLKKVLGDHIQQKGSYVGDNYLRFDFSHYKKITIQELHHIENLVQELIFSDLVLKVKTFNSLQEARKNYSFSEIFEEKYKKEVRVVIFGKSSELCIGTHVKRTGLIQIFEILSEYSVSHGIRRIKAITSKEAVQHLKSIRDQYQSLKKMIKYPESPIKSFLTLQKSNEKFKKEISKVHLQIIKILKKEYYLKAVELSPIKIKYICEIDPDQEKEINIMKKIVLDLRYEIHNLFMIIGFVTNEKAVIFISISDSVIKNNNIYAHKIICKMAPHIGGKYWGNSFFSTAMGPNKNGLNLVLKDAIAYQNHFKKINNEIK